MRFLKYSIAKVQSSLSIVCLCVCICLRMFKVIIYLMPLPDIVVLIFDM